MICKKADDSTLTRARLFLDMDEQEDRNYGYGWLQVVPPCFLDKYHVRFSAYVPSFELR